MVTPEAEYVRIDHQQLTKEFEPLNFFSYKFTPDIKGLNQLKNMPHKSTITNEHNVEKDIFTNYIYLRKQGTQLSVKTNKNLLDFNGVYKNKFPEMSCGYKELNEKKVYTIALLLCNFQ